MNHVMIDIETMATSVDAVVMSIGLVFFDPAGKDDRPILGDTYYDVLNATEQARHGRVINKNTMNWWSTQGPDALHVIEHSADCEQHMPELLFNVKNFLKTNKAVCVWGNGPSFDNAIINHLFRQYLGKDPWQFWRDRDYRTLKMLVQEAGIEKNDAVLGTAHHALDDAVFQAKNASIWLGRINRRLAE